jgi:hypothetical protein
MLFFKFSGPSITVVPQAMDTDNSGGLDSKEFCVAMKKLVCVVDHYVIKNKISSTVLNCRKLQGLYFSSEILILDS